MEHPKGYTLIDFDLKFQIIKIKVTQIEDKMNPIFSYKGIKFDRNG
jgi:hypothetical protein